MELSLSPEFEAFVTQKVSSGEFPSASEVVHEALRLMRGQDELQQKREELRQEIARGIAEADQGLTDPFDEALLAQIKQRARARGQNGTAAP